MISKAVPQLKDEEKITLTFNFDILFVHPVEYEVPILRDSTG